MNERPFGYYTWPAIGVEPVLPLEVVAPAAEATSAAPAAAGRAVVKIDTGYAVLRATPAETQAPAAEAGSRLAARLRKLASGVGGVAVMGLAGGGGFRFGEELGGTAAAVFLAGAAASLARVAWHFGEQYVQTRRERRQ